MTDLPVHVRELRPGDKNYIINSWTTGMVTECLSLNADFLFFLEDWYVIKRYRMFIIRLFKTHPQLFRIICNEEDESQIFGWACVDGSTLHWVHVKSGFHRDGLYELLTPSCTFTSHRTGEIQKLKLRFEPDFFKKLIRNSYELTRRNHDRSDKAETSSATGANGCAGVDNSDATDGRTRAAGGNAP